MKEKFTNALLTTRKYIAKHSPEILTGLGIAGMISATALAVKETPKAIELIELKKKELKTKKLTTIETIKAAWRPYIPAASMIIVSSSCLIGASTINYKRNAALATAYSLSEKTLLSYRDKVIETIGEKKEKTIRDKVAQEDMKTYDPNQVIITSKGNVLCKDSISGRYFRSDLDIIRKAVNELNRKMTYQNYISLNEFYYSIGLDRVKEGDNMGWNIDKGLIELDFDACITNDDEPCIVIDYIIVPEYGYDK